MVNYLLQKFYHYLGAYLELTLSTENSIQFIKIFKLFDYLLQCLVDVEK